jgi:hypothetical protein
MSVLPPSAYEKLQPNFTTMPGTTKGILKRGETNSQVDLNNILNDSTAKREKKRPRALLTQPDEAINILSGVKTGEHTSNNISLMSSADATLNGQKR